ncbi:TlpA disulfide reductase family protein [Gemmatimonas sp.]|uniref:TlpA family protein disulfide reductase n=1 Tax=Gemmatimonas sp. TaxID=1962908 RepID=UPI00286CD1A9|nr:TlpA disulfide reductase family protein [Gemmatimonas sp.]
MTSFVRAGLFALAAGVMLSACERSATPRAPSLGAPAPAFTAMTLEGEPVALASLSGSVVVLNVWATWCIPCREEIPQLEALHREYGAQGLKTIGVSIDAAGMSGDVRDFATEQGMTYPIWLDPDHQFSLKFLTVGVPETFVIDRAGVIRFRMIGAFRRGDTTLAAAVRRAMAS